MNKGCSFMLVFKLDIYRELNVYIYRFVVKKGTIAIYANIGKLRALVIAFLRFDV